MRMQLAADGRSGVVPATDVLAGPAGPFACGGLVVGDDAEHLPMREAGASL